MKKIYIFFIFALCYFNLNAQIEFHVSPDGNDANSGTAVQPLASLTGARNAIRLYKMRHPSPVSFTVIIAGGTYTIDKAFVLTPEDSGTPGYPVIYKAKKGTTPVFSGGKKINGFTVNEKGIWEVKIPKSNIDNWRFDQLYVNDKRAVLARMPNNGFIKIAGVKQEIIKKGNGRIPEKARLLLTFDSSDFNTLQKISDEEIGKARFRTYHKWDFTMRHIDKIINNSMAIASTGRGMKPWNPVKKHGRIVFENFAAALDTAGEWHLDNQGVLSYIPLPGQTPENTKVVIPITEKLIVIKGDISGGKYVENITFEGLTFKYCNYPIPPRGFEPNQAAVSVNAAVLLEGARNITFSNCEISHTGQHAFWFGKGCRNSSVQHCYLHDLGGGGIYLGDILPLEGDEHTQNITLDNNIIQSGGREFPPATAIWLGHSSDNTVSHNDIGDFYYTGISAGWVWGYGQSLAKRNKIIYNHIHHIGWDLLSDMAAIYTLGKSEGTVVSNNVIHHIHAYSYGGWGLYPDEGTTGITMENNLVYNTKTGAFHQHYGKNNIIRNNIFAFSKLYQIQCTRVEKHRSFDFTNNIVVFDRGVVLKGPWNKINIFMDYNLYWNTAGSNYDFAGNNFKHWQQTGHDTHSLIEEPGFINANKYDFRLKNDKSTKKIYFKAFDYTKAGVYGDNNWKQKAILPLTIITAFDKAVERNMGRR